MPEDLLPVWQSFQQQAERVEQARQALLRCLPVGRVEPAPIGLGLDLLRDELLAVRGELDVWRHPAVGEEWLDCQESITEALDGIEPAREVSLSTGELEILLGAVADVIEPLDAWATAERAWLRLRVKTP